MNNGFHDVILAFMLCPLPLALLTGFILAWRYMRHLETLKMIEAGMTTIPSAPETRSNVSAPMELRAMPVGSSGGRGLLGWAAALTGFGLAISFALWPIGAFVEAGGGVHLPLGLGPWMLVGFVPLFVGLGLMLTWVLTRPNARMVVLPSAMAAPTLPAAPLSPQEPIAVAQASAPAPEQLEVEER